MTNFTYLTKFPSRGTFYVLHTEIDYLNSLKEKNNLKFDF